LQIFRNAREQVDELAANREHDRHDGDRDPRRDQTVLDGRRAGLVVPEFSQLVGDLSRASRISGPACFKLKTQY
jgi:hypothetical protein